MTERIDLARADDPRDVVHRAVACLAQGGLVGLPSESNYGLAASALDPIAVDRLDAAAGDAPDRRPTLLLRGPDEVDDWAEVGAATGRKLARRGWPGPITFTFPASPRGLAARLPGPVRDRLVPDGRIALRAPAHRMVREVLRLLPGPVVQVEPAASALADDLAGLDGLDMILDVGPTPLGGPPTVVAVDTEGWRVVREGVMPASRIAQLAGTIFLFVCTGNTCRSPMAEAICKALLARRLGCDPLALEEKGIVVLSAGVSAMDGMPAASNAIAAVRSRGGSLAEHASRRALPDLVRNADHVVAMTSDHLDALLNRVPEVAERARLLDPDGLDIDDPIGCDQSVYDQTAREIERHLGRLLDELGY